MTPSLKRSRGHDDTDVSPSSLKKTTGSPSREYLAELSLQHEHYNKELFAKLEADERRRGKSYKDALAAAKAEHDRIRRAAQRAQEWNLLQVEKAKQQQEDEEARDIERQKHQQLEQEIADRRRRAEESHRLEQLRKQAEIEQKQHDEEAKRRAEDEKEESRRAQERQKAEEKQALQGAQNQVKPTEPSKDAPAQANGIRKPPAAITTTTSLITTSQQAKEDEHNRYLNLHKWLKDMRKTVEVEAKKDPTMKPLLGDWRREIKKCVGQLTVGKNATVVPRKKILEVLRRARGYNRVLIDVRPCFAQGAPSDLQDQSSAQVSGLLIYYLNILSKAIVNQWASEGSAKIEAADPPGILATYIFAVEDTKIKSHTLIDILLAKLHKSCPVLFGIYGSEKTDAGRRRLGWERELDPKTNRKNHWIPEQRHHDRMQGLGAGYASISLRDFSKAPIPNPHPPINYWRAMARIVNTPAKDITISHLIVLKAMIEKSVERFAKFFRKAAQVALRTALIEFPRSVPDGPAKVGLTTLPQILRKNYNIRL